MHRERTAAAVCLVSRDGETADWMIPDHPFRQVDWTDDDEDGEGKQEMESKTP